MIFSLFSKIILVGEVYLIENPVHCPSELSPNAYNSPFLSRTKECLAPTDIFEI